MILSCALLVAMSGGVPPSPEVRTGIQLVRVFNTVESREAASGGYKTAEELQGAKAFDALAENPGLGDTVAAMNRGDLAHPVAGWTVRIYTSADRKHYLISAENADGVVVYSDERGMIRTGAALQ